MSSQHCGRCFRRFPLRTRSHRFKICTDCIPKLQARPANMTVTQLSHRKLRAKRASFCCCRCQKKQWSNAVIITDRFKTFWNRDIVAAQLILERGMHKSYTYFINCFIHSFYRSCRIIWTADTRSNAITTSEQQPRAAAAAALIVFQTFKQTI